jgi:hypothetical protein
VVQTIITVSLLVETEEHQRALRASAGGLYIQDEDSGNLQADVSVTGYWCPDFKKNAGRIWDSLHIALHGHTTTLYMLIRIGTLETSFSNISFSRACWKQIRNMLPAVQMWEMQPRQYAAYHCILLTAAV